MRAIPGNMGKLSEDVDTYVYVDVSNIRASCLKTLNFKIDFEKVYIYLAGKYKKLRSVYYYEGIAADDAEKAE